MFQAATAFAFALVLSGCDNDERTAAPAAGPPAAMPTEAHAATPTEAQMAQWNRSCALCHVDGTGGAPRVGIADVWAARIAAGDEVLLTHTLEGFNNMPPLGYCMSCTEEDFRALIRFMSQSRGPQ